jgi:hypothetical protein
MKSIEIINLKRVAITKKDLLLMDKFDDYVSRFCEGVEPEQTEDGYFFLDELTAHVLGLITHAEMLEMIDYNSRVTLQGVKKYHWKELANTESSDGTWDITFNLKKNGYEEHIRLEQELAKLREEKNSIVRSQKYEDAARLRDKEKQLMAQIGDPVISFSVYDGDNLVTTFKVTEPQFEQLVDLIKRIA